MSVLNDRIKPYQAYLKFFLKEQFSYIVLKLSIQNHRKNIHTHTHLSPSFGGSGGSIAERLGGEEEGCFFLVVGTI